MYLQSIKMVDDEVIRAGTSAAILATKSDRDRFLVMEGGTRDGTKEKRGKKENQHE